MTWHWRTQRVPRATVPWLVTLQELQQGTGLTALSFRDDGLYGGRCCGSLRSQNAIGESHDTLERDC